MTKHAAPAGSQCGAQGQFFLPPSSLCQQEIGYVDAGDQENHAHYAHQQAADEDELVVVIHPHSCIGERRQRHTAAGIVFGIGLFQLRSNGLQRRFRRAQAPAIFQTAEDGSCQEAAVVKVVFEEAREHLGIHTDRNPNLFRAAESKHPFEGTGADSDYGVRCRIQVYNLSDDVGISAEFVYPQVVAQYRDIVASRLRVFVR